MSSTHSHTREIETHQLSWNIRICGGKFEDNFIFIKFKKDSLLKIKLSYLAQNVLTYHFNWDTCISSNQPILVQNVTAIHLFY